MDVTFRGIVRWVLPGHRDGLPLYTVLTSTALLAYNHPGDYAPRQLVSLGDLSDIQVTSTRSNTLIVTSSRSGNIVLLFENSDVCEHLRFELSRALDLDHICPRNGTSKEEAQPLTTRLHRSGNTTGRKLWEVGVPVTNRRYREAHVRLRNSRNVSSARSTTREDDLYNMEEHPYPRTSPRASVVSISPWRYRNDALRGSRYVSPRQNVSYPPVSTALDSSSLANGNRYLHTSGHDPLDPVQDAHPQRPRYLTTQLRERSVNMSDVSTQSVRSAFRNPSFSKKGRDIPLSTSSPSHHTVHTQEARRTRRPEEDSNTVWNLNSRWSASDEVPEGRHYTTRWGAGRGNWQDPERNSSLHAEDEWYGHETVPDEPLGDEPSTIQVVDLPSGNPLGKDQPWKMRGARSEGLGKSELDRRDCDTVNGSKWRQWTAPTGDRYYCSEVTNAILVQKRGTNTLQLLHPGNQLDWGSTAEEEQERIRDLETFIFSRPNEPGADRWEEGGYDYDRDRDPSIVRHVIVPPNLARQSSSNPTGNVTPSIRIHTFKISDQDHPHDVEFSDESTRPTRLSMPSPKLESETSQPSRLKRNSSTKSEAYSVQQENARTPQHNAREASKHNTTASTLRPSPLLRPGRRASLISAASEEAAAPTQTSAANRANRSESTVTLDVPRHPSHASTTRSERQNSSRKLSSAVPLGSAPVSATSTLLERDLLESEVNSNRTSDDNASQADDTFLHNSMINDGDASESEAPTPASSKKKIAREDWLKVRYLLRIGATMTKRHSALLGINHNKWIFLSQCGNFVSWAPADRIASNSEPVLYSGKDVHTLPIDIVTSVEIGVHGTKKIKSKPKLFTFITTDRLLVLELPNEADASYWCAAWNSYIFLTPFPHPLDHIPTSTGDE